VVVITGHASVDSAIEAVRIGASDYLVKPVDVERLLAILRRQPQAAELKSEIGELREELRRVGRFGHMSATRRPCRRCTTSSAAWRPRPPRCC
jgi:DNA-binding NtrC family response regulator